MGPPNYISVDSTLIFILKFFIFSLFHLKINRVLCNNKYIIKIYTVEFLIYNYLVNYKNINLELFSFIFKKYWIYWIEKERPIHAAISK